MEHLAKFVVAFVLLGAVLLAVLNDARIKGGSVLHYKMTMDRGGSVDRVDFPEEWRREVERSLEYFRTHWNESMRSDAFVSTWEKFKRGYFVRIVNGSMYVEIRRSSYSPWEKEFHEMCRILDLLCSGEMKKDVDFIFNFADEPVVDTRSSPFPVFSWTKTVLYTDLLIPYTSFNHLPEKKPGKCDFEETIKRDWEPKVPHGIWRGATTGVDPFTKDNWREQARPKLVLICNNRSDICDARISEYVQAAPDVIQEMKEELGVEARMSPEEQDGYKYALVMDGNSAPSSRMKSHLERSSLIVKQSSPFIEFFYASIHPYIHYVPIARSLEDLASVILWARAHDDDALHMVANSRKFACENFNKETVRAYMKYVFSEYIKLFDRFRAPIETRNLVRVSFSEDISNTCPDIPASECPFFAHTP